MRDPPAAGSFIAFPPSIGVWELIDDKTGEAYRASFLAPSDDGMLWSAIFLDLLENPDEPPPIMRVSPPPESVADAAEVESPES